MTDNAGRPHRLERRVIGVAAVRTTRSSCARTCPTPSNPGGPARSSTLAAGYDQEQEPFAVTTRDGTRVGTLHYGESALSQQTPGHALPRTGDHGALLPGPPLGPAESRRRTSRSLLFAGMAKETAHQLGTPLTTHPGLARPAAGRARQGSDDSVVTELGRDVDAFEQGLGPFQPDRLPAQAGRHAI